MDDASIPLRPAPRAVGFDPGLADTGYAALEGGRRVPTVLGTGVIRTSARDPLEVRLEALFDGARDVLERFAPDLVIIEDIFSAPSIPRTAILMGHARAAVCLAGRRQRVLLISVAPAEVKRAVTASGAAPKAQVARAVQALLAWPPPATQPRRRRARACLHRPLAGSRTRRTMIASLRGRLRRRLEGRVILESAGVGYEVVLPPVVARGLEDLMAGDGADAAELELVIYYHATRDQPRPVLIGFARDVEREFFERLITVKDVGPLVAARALIAPIADIAEAIVRKDERFLRKLPGIGPQKCRNIVAQLEGKVAKYALLPREEAPKPPEREEGDEVRVLVRDILVRQMGLRPGEADQAIREALARRPDIDAPEALFEEIYRARRGSP